MKRYRTAGILLVLILVMSAVAYWDEETTKKEEIAEKSKNKLFELAASDVTSVLYRTSNEGGGEALQVELSKSSEGVWQLNSPVQGKADQTAVNDLIKQVLDAKYTKEIEKDKSALAEFGLTEPTRIIRLETADGKSASLHFGMKAPVGFSVYLKTGDSDHVYLAGQQILTATAKKLRDFRDKTLVSGLDEASVKEIQFSKRGQPNVRLVKNGKDYAMVEPVASEADIDEARDLIESLAAQKIEDFVSAPESALVQSFEPSKRWGALAWVDSSGSQRTVLMSDYDGKFWLAFDPKTLVYKVGDQDKSKYDKDVLMFRNRRIFDFDSDSVAEVDIDGTEYQKVKGQFYTADKAAGAAKDPATEPATKVKELVEDLEFAKTEKFLTKNDVKGVLDKAPKHRIKILHDPKKGEKTTYTLDVFPAEKGKMSYLKRADKETIYVVPSRVLSSLQPDAEGEDAAESDSDLMEPLELDSLSN